MVKKISFPILFLVLAYFILTYESAKIIVAGVAVFLVGVFFMEEGFKLFSGSFFERILEKFTNTLPKSLGSGFLITSIIQSSSLTSVILISFLGTGLIGLGEAIGVVLGSSLGSTTTAWLISVLGLKIKISHYAMPILIFGIFFRFSKNEKYKGFGNILLGLGFIFLGISYLINGFSSLKNFIDLSTFVTDGYLGIGIYFLIGAVMTFIIQSSSASMAIILTALASTQITYMTALAIMIGGKVGSTTTTILGSLSSNENGKRLAIAQLIFNLVSASFAIIFIYQIIYLIDFVAHYFGLNFDNYVIKLTMFHTIFNVAAIIIVAPFIPKLVVYLQKLFVPKTKSWASPKYLNKEVIKIPKTALISLRKESQNLYFNFLKAIMHLMNIKHEDVFLNRYKEKSKINNNVKIDKVYKENLKSLYVEILKYGIESQKNMKNEDIKIVNMFKLIAGQMIKLLNNIKTLQKNIDIHKNCINKYIKKEYDFLEDMIIMVLIELKDIRQNHNLDDIDKMFKSKSLKQKLNSLDLMSSKRIDNIIKAKTTSSEMITNLINDLSFTLNICKKLIDITTILWVEDKILLELGEEHES
ncbi:Na/Pi cotransporter family protein [Arcobacter sp.]|uniref:Na/Pi cotransporter family protein n=1 Tax=unclassified Arcobacter TaxID=2593671 RepID=UPI003AFF6822